MSDGRSYWYLKTFIRPITSAPPSCIAPEFRGLTFAKALENTNASFYMETRRRKQNQKPLKVPSKASMDGSSPAPPISTPAPAAKKPTTWLTLAIISGFFAALNGVFAKLTTTTQLHYASTPLLSYLLRAIFFGLNLTSNATMWFLFTRALTSASSATRVSILNTSANFLLTAMLGLIIFQEALPLGWWAGASLLVAGSVVIGARDGGEAEGKIALGEGVDLGTGGTGLGEAVAEEFRDEVDEGEPQPAERR